MRFNSENIGCKITSKTRPRNTFSTLSQIIYFQHTNISDTDIMSQVSDSHSAEFPPSEERRFRQRLSSINIAVGWVFLSGLNIRCQFVYPNHIVVLPQIVPFDFGEDEINAMDMVSASCTVNKGDLPMKISWTRNGRQLFSNDGISISRTNQRISILSIESVRDRHSGNYSCVAENLAGSVNYTTSLWVNGTHLRAKLIPFRVDQSFVQYFVQSV